MEFRVLGPFEVVDAGEALTLRSAQQRAVLALLIIHAPEPLSLDRLIDELWGERPPATAEHAVQVHISGIRKHLRGASAHEAEVALHTSPSGYVLEVDAEKIDARRFERLLHEGQSVLAEDPLSARRLLEAALTLWRGEPLLGDLGHSSIAQHEAERLVELRTVAAEGLIDARLAGGEHAELIGSINRLVADNPLRERTRRQLMLALYRSGRHAEALAAYRDACGALDEIGLQPGPELRRLEEAILRHDPSLGYPQPAADAAVELSSAVAAPAAALDRPPGMSAVAAVAVEVGERRDAPAPVRRRKVMTALFCEVTGSTGLGEELDPEALVEVMNRCWLEVRTVVERHGGTVATFIGDAVMAAFGIPRAGEDDALRAVRAAAEIRERLPAVAEEVGVALSLRTAVNTGIVLVGDEGNLAIGDAVNVAARLERAAAPGEILLGEETVQLVRDAVQVEALEPLALTGTVGPVRAFRLLSADPRAPGFARHLEVPLVGRERELGLLRWGWNRSVEECGCHLFTLLGMAGVGKSRLVAELIASLRDTAIVLQGRCLHYGEGITFWPLLEALTTGGEQAKPVIERLSHGGAATPEELFFEVRRLLETLALECPVILHVDDLQWAEPMLLDLLDHITELSRGSAIMVLCSARPELLEDRPSWGGGKLNATTVLLQPLTATDCALLLDQLGDGLAPDARARVIAASEGNPLFLEEIAALAREQGTVSVPPTIQALLAARLERLPFGERELLELGAIEGEVFHIMPLRTLSDREAVGLEGAIAGLVRKELIRPHPSSFRGDRAFRFRHLLIRDAAYDSVPKAARSELHERLAGWLEENAGEFAELDEISGWHLEQAARYRLELGRKVQPALAQRAAEHLYAAGTRATERGDVVAAVNLLDRALALAPADSTVKATASVDLAEQLIDIGDLARVAELLDAAERDPYVADRAALTRFEWMIHAEPQGATRAIQATLPRILERFRDANDARGLAKAHMAASAVHWLATQATTAGEELRLVAKYAREAENGGMRSRALAQYVLALIYGPQDATTIGREIAAIENEDLGPYLEAFVDLGRGELQRLQGNLEQARGFTNRAIEGLGSLGMGAAQGGLEQDLGQIELSAGEPAAAIAALLRSDEILAAAGERALRSTTQAHLADAHERLGNRNEARAAVELSEELSATEDVINYVITHRVRARLALAEGDHATAESWARSAVDYACRTDFTRNTAQARLDLARVLMAIGRRTDALSEASKALALHDAKGDHLGIAEAQALLQNLRASGV